jgi:tape measure domain-containing protein
MANSITGLSIKLDMDYANVTKGAKQVKSEISTINSEMRKNMSVFDRAERSTAKYETRLTGLEKKLDAQGRAVDNARDKYELMVEAHGESSEEAQKALRALNNQEAQYNNLSRVVESARQDLANFNKEQRIANSSWTKIGKQLDVTGDKIIGVGTKMQSVGSTLTRSITVPVAGAVAAVGTLTAAFGWDRLVGLDSAQAQLKGLGYSTEEVGRISEQVTSAIEGGMTTMAEGTSVAAGALAAGVEEGAELERYIKLVGDAAVGANRPVSDMAMIFNRVQGSGKLMTENLNMIEEGMPGFSNAMAEHYGVSQEAFREMVTNGEVDAATFLDVMEGFAGGMAGAYSESFAGMVDNTKAYVGIIGENILGGVFQESKSAIADFIEVLKSEAVISWAQRTGEVIGEAFTKVVNAIRSAVTWFVNLDGSQQKLIGSLVGIAVAAGPVLSIAGGLAIKFGALLKIVSPLFLAIGKGGLGGAIAALAKRFSFLFGPIGITIGVITTLIGVFTTAYAKSESFRNIVNSLVERFVSFIPTIVQFAQSIYNNFMNIITPAINAVRDFFIDMFMKIRQFWEQDGAQVMEAIKNAINVIHGIVSAVMPVITTIIGTAFKLVLKIVTMVWENIKGVIQGGLNVIIGGVKIFTGIFTGDFSKMWEGVKQIFSGAIEFIWNLFQLMFWGRIVKGITSLVKTALALFNGLRQNAVGIFRALWDTAATIWGMISKSIVGFVKGIFNSAKTIFTTMWTTIRNIFTGILNTGRTIWTTFSNVTRSIFGAIRSFMSNIWQNIWRAVTTTAKSLWAVVRGIWNVFLSVTRTIFNTVWRVMSSIFRGIWRTVSNIVKSLWNAVKAVWLTFRTTTNNIFRSLWNTLRMIFRNIYNSVSTTVKNLWSSVRGTWNTFSSTTGRIFGRVKDTLTRTWNSIKDSVTKIVDKLWSSVKGTFDTMKNGISNIIESITEKIGDMVDAVKKGINKLIEGINWVAEKIGMDSLPKIKLSTGTQQINRRVSTTYDGRLKEGTFATVGDRGPGNGPGGYRNELIEYPNGKIAMTPNKDTMTYLPRGARVINGRDTHAIMNAPRYSRGTGLGEFIGNTASKAWEGAKDLGSKAMEKVGDVWDYATNPGKLVDKVIDSFGFNFDFAKGSLIKDLLDTAYKKLKDGVKNLFTGWFEEAGSGDGSSFTKFRVTTPYSPNSPVPGYPRDFNNGHHYGIDYATPTGTTLTATNSGQVTKLNDVGGGLVARLISGKFTQFFMHLSDILKTGRVEQGEAFAKTGNSGKWTTGPHLHYQVEKGNSQYVTNKNTVDPDEYLSGGGAGGAAKAAGAWRPQVVAALKKNGLPTTKPYVDAWIRQIDTESSGNARAVQSIIDINSGGNEARGLVQVIPPTFNAYKHSGMTNIMNPLHNLVAGMNYAKSRYGRSGMLSVIGKGHGYEKGGILQKEGLFLGAEGNKEEVVIPLHQPSEAMQLFSYVADRLRGQGTQTKNIPSRPQGGQGFQAVEEKLDTLIELMSQFVNGGMSFEMNGREVAKQTYKDIDDMIQYSNRRRNRFNKN